MMDDGWWLMIDDDWLMMNEWWIDGLDWTGLELALTWLALDWIGLGWLDLPALALDWRALADWPEAWDLLAFGGNLDAIDTLRPGESMRVLVPLETLGASWALLGPLRSLWVPWRIGPLESMHKWRVADAKGPQKIPIRAFYTRWLSKCYKFPYEWEEYIKVLDQHGILSKHVIRRWGASNTGRLAGKNYKQWQKQTRLTVHSKEMSPLAVSVRICMLGVSIEEGSKFSPQYEEWYMWVMWHTSAGR